MSAITQDFAPPVDLAFFDETGGVGIEFSQLKFDHLLFAGSGQTGRAVMAAAAQNLCPVALELGGKSPTILCHDYPLRKAPEWLLFVKLLNAGQICTTVDHLYLPEGKRAEFAAAAKEIVGKRYPDLASPDFTSVIDEKSFKRLTAALEDAEAKGATLMQLIPGPKWDPSGRNIAPHIVLNTPAESVLLTRELFDRILPVIECGPLEEPIRAINNGPRLFAIYPFSNDKQTIQTLLDKVMSGMSVSTTHCSTSANTTCRLVAWRKRHGPLPRLRRIHHLRQDATGVLPGLIQCDQVHVAALWKICHQIPRISHQISKLQKGSQPCKLRNSTMS